MPETNITLEEVVDRANGLAPALRNRAAAAEKARRIPDNTIADMMDAGIFRILQPKRVGGYEFDYGPAQFAVGKALGQGCGSSAWVGVLIACHNWLLGSILPKPRTMSGAPRPIPLSGPPSPLQIPRFASSMGATSFQAAGSLPAVSIIAPGLSSAARS